MEETCEAPYYKPFPHGMYGGTCPQCNCAMSKIAHDSLRAGACIIPSPHDSIIHHSPWKSN